MTNKEMRAQLVPTVELLADLVATVERKCKKLKVFNPFMVESRGTLCTQVLQRDNKNYLFIMEGGYRATLYPRAFYTLDQFFSFHREAVREALRLERSIPSKLIAQRDFRSPVTLVDFDPNLDTVSTTDVHGNVSISKEQRIYRAQRWLEHAEQEMNRAKQALMYAQSLEEKH